MNIFKILSAYDGSINEPNVSSFLAYLLDPLEDHGLSSSLVQTILQDFVDSDEKFFTEIINDKGKVVDLSRNSDYRVIIQPEFSVEVESKGKPKAKHRRDIDILIEIYRKDALLYAIALENKITDSSINRKDSQIEDEYLGITSYYGTSKAPQIYFVYLTPKYSPLAIEKFAALSCKEKLHLTWNRFEDTENTVPSLLEKIMDLLEQDSRGLRDPLNNETKFLLKSFLSFIRANFKSYFEEKSNKIEKTNYGKPVFEYFKEFIHRLHDDEAYSVKELKREFSEYVYGECTKQLHNGTRNAKFVVATINERNRGHFQVTLQNLQDKSLLYYPNEEDKDIVKKVSADMDQTVKVYYKDKDNGIFSSMPYAELTNYME